MQQSKMSFKVYFENYYDLVRLIVKTITGLGDECKEPERDCEAMQLEMLVSHILLVMWVKALNFSGERDERALLFEVAREEAETFVNSMKPLGTQL